MLNKSICMGLSLFFFMLWPEIALSAQPLKSAFLPEEIRVGVLRHDAAFFHIRREKGVDFDAELRFPHLGGTFFRALASPRPHLGIGIHDRGDTSQVYAGLTWTLDLHPRFYLEGGLGAAVHNGKLDSHNPDRQRFGSRALFRISLGAGTRITERISLNLLADHMSNAGLANCNNGMDRIGLMIGYAFGTP